jgi:hypothetical protein
MPYGLLSFPIACTAKGRCAFPACEPSSASPPTTKHFAPPSHEINEIPTARPTSGQQHR